MPDQDTVAEGTQGLISRDKAFVAFHNLTPDGFMMFRPVRAETGEIVDLEWSFVNRAAGAIVGRDPEDLIGKRLLVEMPGNRDEGLFDAYVEVLETGQTWQQEFHYDHGDISAWFRTTAAALDDNLAVSFADISEVKKGSERLQNLIDGVIAFVGVLAPDGTLLEVNEPAVAAAGVGREGLIGVPFWKCTWWDYEKAESERVQAAVEAAASGERIRYDAKIRVAGDKQIWIDFQIVPVKDANGNVIEMIPSGVDITERKTAEAHKELLIKELSHRVKNTLATIQSIAGQTMRTAKNIEDVKSSFNARLHAIASCHDLLVASEHQSVSLVALLQGQVMPYTARPERLILDGEDIMLPGDSAHTLGLVLHELATNASKYGALSAEAGVLTVVWHLEDLHGDMPRLLMDWQESGGPVVHKPQRQGFGTRLIERILPASENHNAVLEYRPEGVNCRLEVVLK